MNDAVDRLIVERERMDGRLSRGIWLSVIAHLLLVVAAVAAPLLRPKPRIDVSSISFVPVPRGGGGRPNAQPSAPPAAEPKPEEKPAAPEPPKVIKPPKPEPPKTKGVPDPKSKAKSRPKKEEPPLEAYDPLKDPKAKRSAGPSTQTPGLEFGQPGAGTPDGTDWTGDYYLAGVKNKIWAIWAPQIREASFQPVLIRFTILANGDVTDVQILQSSGISQIDRAAQRAVFQAAPFGPLPKIYGTNTKTIEGLFKPTS
jgi:TonB family protein